MEESKSRVYIKVNAENIITQIEGEYSLSNFADLDECILIEEGTPCDRLNHAQSHYLKKGLTTMDGIYQYKYVNGEVVERSAEEIEADRQARENVPTEPTQLDRIEAQTMWTALMTDTLLEE